MRGRPRAVFNALFPKARPPGDLRYSLEASRPYAAMDRVALVTFKGADCGLFLRSRERHAGQRSHQAENGTISGALVNKEVAPCESALR